MAGELHSRLSSDEVNPLSALGSLVPAPASKSPSTTPVSFDGLLDPPLLLHEDLKNGCGGQLWPAGMVLAKFMLRQHQDRLAGNTILELGAGGGVVGLAVARGCRANAVLITDQLPMLSLMRQNIALNSLETKVTAETLDWGTTLSPSLDKYFHTPASLAEERHPDVVLAADCVYFEPAFPLLLQTMQRLLGPQTICYFCFKNRRKADWKFIRAMKRSFEVLDARYHDQDQDKRAGIYLYEVRKKRNVD